ncbi:hypothetical protein QTP86_008566 [Hemibagrus guttatus]|nr:hypothetical protein QTP86_008566 [Hemibagrus guttatus]
MASRSDSPRAAGGSRGAAVLALCSWFCSASTFILIGADKRSLLHDDLAQLRWIRGDEVLGDDGFQEAEGVHSIDWGVTQDDGSSGVGVEICECELRMKILLIFTLCLISDGGASKKVTGYSGGGVLIKCKYDLSYEKSISETVHVGGDLIVNCKYPESLRSNPKGKFSLYDERANQTFSVSVRGVTEQDSGEYWCGAEADWTSDHGYKVYFTRINLTVTDKHKSWSTPSSPPAGFPASSVITVSVILLLLLIGTIILLMVLQKKQKLQAGSASTTGRRSVKDPGNSQGVPLDACEYEEIKDTRRLSASDAGTFTVYSTADLPTIPSDHHTVYANSDLPTNPCDSGVYSTAQLPTIPSDQDIYSKAQLPTRLSAEESAEDLNYATISEWSHDGRFSIHDNRSAGFVSVFIRELITEDTGSYGCGVVVSDELEIYTVVKLNVREENLNIFSSATSSSDSCLFLSDTVSKPYSMAGLTTVLYTFPLILADIF